MGSWRGTGDRDHLDDRPRRTVEDVRMSMVGFVICGDDAAAQTKNRRQNDDGQQCLFHILFSRTCRFIYLPSQV
jgi:hypothetical protein